MAYSPEEFMDQKNSLEIDIEWYITQQLLPPITRLIEHIEGIEVDFVAQCLGVDGKKYKYASNVGNSGDGEYDGDVANPVIKTETTQSLQHRAVASLKIICPHCDESYEFPEIYHTKKDLKDLQCNVCPNKDCRKYIPDAYIQNRVQLFLKQLLNLYYKGSYKCMEPSCQNQSRQIVYNNKCLVTGCKGRVKAEISEQVTNDTLRYLQGLFNVAKYQNEQSLKQPKLQQDAIHHKEMLDDTKVYVDEFLTRSKYNKVDLSELFSFL